jgi:putative transposase
MLKAYKYQIYPTEPQKALMEQHFGCSRFIYNWGLEQRIKAHSQGKKLTCMTLMNQLPELKEQNPWLKEVNAQSLQMPLRNLDNAFTSFFQKRTAFPKFKSKSRSVRRFQCPQAVRVDFDNNLITLPKLPNIPAILHRKFEGTIKTTTVNKTSTGKYFVSILVDNSRELPSKPKVNPNKTIGLDLGIKDFCITSDGNKIYNPEFKKSREQRVKHHQRKLSKKKNCSKNYARQKLKLALIHERIKNQRKDFLHKASSKLIRENQSICLEDLAVGNMLKNHCLAKFISDIAWSEFRRQLEYKADWYGKNILMIGRFEPSSKMCSNCGFVNNQLTLNQREWICPICGAKHDRDVNAAKNIKQFALLHLLECGQRINKASRRDLGSQLSPVKRRSDVVINLS